MNAEKEHDPDILGARPSRPLLCSVRPGRPRSQDRTCRNRAAFCVHRAAGSEALGGAAMTRRIGVGLAAALGVTGCATAPPLDNPAPIRQPAECVENPVLVSPGVPTAV